MLPHSSRNPAEDNTVEGRLASMSSAGYLPVAKSSAELAEVLDRIKVRRASAPVLGQPGAAGVGAGRAVQRAPRLHREAGSVGGAGRRRSGTAAGRPSSSLTPPRPF